MESLPTKMLIYPHTMLLLIKRDFLQRMRFRDQPYSQKMYLRRFTHDVMHINMKRQGFDGGE